MWKIVLLVLALLYILSPYDLFPDMVIGWGWIDDVVILGFLWRYFYLMKKKRERVQKHYQSDRHHTHGNHNFKNVGGENNARSDAQGRNSSVPWDPYKVLEIDRGASQDDIKRAYRQLAGKYHPDKVEHLGDEFKVLAEKRFKEVQQAYQELKLK